MKYKILINRSKIIVSAIIKGIKRFDLRRQVDDRCGGGVHSKIMKLPKFSFFGKDVDDFEVNVLRFPPQITYFADGLIGMDFLLQFKNIRFDFEEKTIETPIL